MKQVSQHIFNHFNKSSKKADFFVYSKSEYTIESVSVSDRPAVRLFTR